MKKILLILITILSVACSNKTSTDSINTATMVDIDSLNPYKFVSSTTDEIMLNVYEGLVKASANADIETAIASSYEISEDGLVYSFEIRDNVYFHNGSKLTVSDVVFSLNKMKELALQSNFANIKEIIAKDNSVIIKLEKEDSSLIYYLTTAIVDEQTFDELDKKANGTGPYFVSNYERQQKIQLKKFDKYYQEKANIENINIDILANFELGILKLQSGEYNFLSGINSKRIGEIKDKNILTRPRNMMFILALNNKIFSKDDIEIINSYIDKDEIIKQVTDSYAKKIGIDTPKTSRELSKKEITITIPANDTIYIDSAQVIKEQLGRNGIKVNIKTIEWASWLKEVYANRDYEATIIGFTGKLDKDAIYRRYVSDYSKNFINFNNLEYDNLIKLAKTEINSKKRDEIYKKAEEILYKEYASVFIMNPEIIVAMDNNIDNYVAYNIPFINFAKLKFKDK